MPSLRDTLARTRNSIFGKVQTLLGQADITPDTWDELEVLLLQADVGAATTEKLLETLKQRANDEAIVKADKLREALKDELRKLLNPEGAPAYVYDQRQLTMYAVVSGERFPIAAIQLSDIDPVYLRRVVPYPSNEPAGTIVIDPQNHFLYSVQEGGRAMRYGIGVGRQGFGWTGTANIRNKQEWPDWYPPKEMIQRQPELGRQLSQLQSGLGVAGGPRNPLGARAMYLWQGDKDTLYRIHGTIEPWTIGRSVSSGCIRMLNQDVIDLYQRTPIGTKVIVLGSSQRVSR
jgi:lipoprotein-anchoring transpeptidase ErfK/SrfK